MISLKHSLKLGVHLVIFLFLLSSLLVSNVTADTLPTPFLQEGDSKDDYGYSVVQTTDGGYAFAGYTLSSGAGGKDFLLVKTDVNGNLQWSVAYGGEEDEIAYSVIQTGSGDYLVAGTTTSWTKGETDCLLVKVDSSGKVVDNRTYGGTGYDVIYEIIEDAPFYALVGWTNSDAAGGNDFWFLKLDSNLNVELSMVYGGQLNDIAESIVAVGGGSYVIAGYSYSYGINGDLWCIRIDSAGIMNAELTFGGPGQDGGRSIIRSSGGGYAIGGYKSYDVNNVCDFWLVKVDANLQVKYEQVFGESTLEERAWSIVQMEDGGYVLAGYAYSDSQKYDVMLVKTESDTYSGVEKWLKTYDGSENEIAECVILPKDDSGIVVSGYTSSYGKGNDFLLLKTSTNGVGQWSATYGTIKSLPPDGFGDYGHFIVFGVSIAVLFILLFVFKQRIRNFIRGKTTGEESKLKLDTEKTAGEKPKPEPKLKLDKSTSAEIVNLLCKYQFSSHESRRALMNLAFQSCDPLYDQIDMSGAPHAFAAHLIPLLIDFGEIERGKQALIALLETMSPQLGIGDQETITRIIKSLVDQIKQ